MFRKTLVISIIISLILLWTTIVFAGEDLGAFTEADINWKQFEGQKLEVAFTSHPWQEQLEPFIPQFEKLTGISIELKPHLPTMEYRQKRAMESVSGAWDADVYMLCPIGFAPKYAFEGWAEPLDEYIKNTELTDPDWYHYEDFFSSAREFTSSDGIDHYTLPITAEAQVLFYRKDLFAEKGLKVPKTMEELYNVAQELNNPPGLYGITLRGRIDSNWWPVQGFLASYGGGWFDEDWDPIIDSPESIQALEMYGKLARDYGTPGITDFCFDEICNALATGRTAMYLDASVAYPRFQDHDKSVVAGKIGTAVMPAGPAGSKPNVHFWGIAMNTKSQKKEASWLFMQWATSKPIQKELAINGIAPPRASIWETKEFKEINSEDFISAVKTSLANGSTGPLHVDFSEFQHELTKRVQDIITGNKTAEEAAQKISGKWDSILEE